MRLDVELEGRQVTVDVERTDTGWRLRHDDGEWFDVPGRYLEAGQLHVEWKGRNQWVGTHVDGDRVALQVHTQSLSSVVVDPRSASAALAGGAAEGVLATPMPGVVVRIPVEIGQEVKAGDVVVVVEAMKMENEFKAPVDGVVGEIPVVVGQALEANAVLARIE